ncbi:MAG: Ldh family oxidoreductase [Pseudomonadota bacterium]
MASEANETVTLSLAEIRQLAEAVLTRAGMAATGSAAIADLVMMSERDGIASHGLRMLPAYAKSFASGYANPDPNPQVSRTAPAVLRGDGDNGYYQILRAMAEPDLIALAKDTGIAAFAAANIHHLGALRFDTEPFAEAGLVALSVVNSLSMVVPHGGARPAFGTNPMSFAAPRPGAAPIVWDQAASMVALMDVRLAAAEGRQLSYPAGLDADGAPSTDPEAILETGQLLPFGAHKGSAIAMMVEILGAALAGGVLAVDNEERLAHGGINIKGGATLIVLDPARFGQDRFGETITRIVGEIEGNGAARVPGDGRLARRAAADRDGVPVSAALLSDLKA